MTPFIAPIMPCRRCGHVGRPTLTTATTPHVYIAYCQQCGARIKAIPSLAQVAPDGPMGHPTSTIEVGHPILLAERCKHCGEVDIPRLNPGRGPHAAAAVCPQCTGFLRWVKKSVMAQLQTPVEGA
jgi:hypothetical protein